MKTNPLSNVSSAPERVRLGFFNAVILCSYVAVAVDLLDPADLAGVAAHVRAKPAVPVLQRARELHVDGEIHQLAGVNGRTVTKCCGDANGAAAAVGLLVAVGLVLLVVGLRGQLLAGMPRGQRLPCLWVVFV